MAKNTVSKGLVIDLTAKYHHKNYVILLQSTTCNFNLCISKVNRRNKLLIVKNKN